MMALTALSIDAMLPALPTIGDDLLVQSPNDRQLIISMIFMGLAFGQLFFGPLSDSTGRKPAIYGGLGLFMVGTLLCMFAINFPMMLVGRLLQGLGVSAPRAVGLALVRDQFEGRAMARVMSFVMTVFILVPMLAPTLGQAILEFSSWRAIFGSFLLLSLIALVWFALRQPETLALADRIPFTAKRIVSKTQEIIKNRLAFGYTAVAGLISGAFIGYLNSAQQIFQEQYALGDRFPLYFGVVASSLGLASLLNSWLVIQLGMRLLVRTALQISVVLSAVALGAAVLFCRAATFLAVHGLFVARFLLCGCAVWQPECTGYGTIGQGCGHWCSNCWFGFYFNFCFAGDGYRTKLQRYGYTAYYWPCCYDSALAANGALGREKLAHSQNN